MCCQNSKTNTILYILQNTFSTKVCIDLTNDHGGKTVRNQKDLPRGIRTFAWVFQYSQFVLIKFKRFSTGNTLIMCDVTIGHSRNSHTELSTIKNFHLLYKQIFSLEILQYKKRLQSAYDTFFFLLLLFYSPPWRNRQCAPLCIQKKIRY